MSARRLERRIALARAVYPEGALLAGAASVELTPRNARSVLLAGFGANRRATSVRDPIEARALVLDDGARTVALVSVDLIGLLLSSVERVRALLGRGATEALVVAATHTHSAPDTLGLWGPAALGVPVASGIDRGWLERTERRIALAVLKASSCLEPAVLRAGTSRGGAELVVNLREPCLTDTQFLVLLAERPDGTPIANVLNYGCHAEALGPENTAISADIVADTCQVLDRERGGLTLFLQGALGAMVTPGVRERAPVAERARYAHWVGDSLGASAMSAIRKAERVERPRVALLRRTVTLPVENLRFRLGRALGVVARPIDQGTLRSEVGLLTLGDVRLALLPGEPDPVVGVAARTLAGGRCSGVVALANDELGYLMTDPTQSDPRYAYERSMSLGPGTVGRLFGALLDLEREAARFSPPGSEAGWNPSAG